MHLQAQHAFAPHALLAKVIATSQCRLRYKYALHRTPLDAVWWRALQELVRLGLMKKGIDGNFDVRVPVRFDLFCDKTAFSFLKGEHHMLSFTPRLRHNAHSGQHEGTALEQQARAGEDQLHEIVLMFVAALAGEQRLGGTRRALRLLLLSATLDVSGFVAFRVCLVYFATALPQARLIAQDNSAYSALPQLWHTYMCYFYLRQQTFHANSLLMLCVQAPSPPTLG